MFRLGHRQQSDAKGVALGCNLVASIKGLVAGSINLSLAFTLGATLPPLPNLAGALTVGFLAYGVSLVLFVVGLRHLGSATSGHGDDESEQYLAEYRAVTD